MRIQRRVMLLLLCVALLLPGCSLEQIVKLVTPAEATQAPTEMPTEIATEAATEAPTEAPTEPTEPEAMKLADPVFPETDKATGTLKFYIKGKEVYAGGPVSNLLDAGVTTYDDLDEIVRPWHMTGVKRVRVELEDTKDKDKPYVFYVAMNAGDEPKKLSECLIYSLTINTDKGIEFGSGKETEPFVTGTTTRKELVAAYGDPNYLFSRHDDYYELAYYEPFNCAYFSFKKGKLRQVYTYYSANVFADKAEGFEYDFGNSYLGNDCYILMSQYMDVMPYLAGEKMEKQGIGVVDALTESITMAGLEMKLGIRCKEMPELFGAPLWDQLLYLHKMRYVRMGRTNPEEFYILNLDGKDDAVANDRVIKGVFTQNVNYRNWGKDNSAFHEFQYENLTNESTIEDVLEQYGQPMELHCTSYSRACFAWLFYKDQTGNTLKICVDPILNQLIELRVEKYYEGQIMYP